MSFFGKTACFFAQKYDKLEDMEKNTKKYHKWVKKPKEWAKELNCSISTIRHNGEEWCKYQLDLMHAGTRNERKAHIFKRQLQQAEKDHSVLIEESPEELTPDERQKQRIYKNTMSILDRLLIKLEIANELSADQARLVNAQLKAVELVIRVSQ